MPSSTYEDIITPLSEDDKKPGKTISKINLPKVCEKEIKKIIEELHLRGESAKYEGVFQKLEL